MKRAAKDTWATQEAKTYLTQVIARARKVGPQVITKHGKPQATVISTESAERLGIGKPRQRDFAEFLLSMPKLDEETIAVINGRHGHSTRNTDHLFDRE